MKQESSLTFNRVTVGYKVQTEVLENYHFVPSGTLEAVTISSSHWISDIQILILHKGRIWGQQVDQEERKPTEGVSF